MVNRWSPKPNLWVRIPFFLLIIIIEIFHPCFSIFLISF